MAARLRHQENISKVVRVAERLQHLRERVVFIGGAIVGLLVTDRAAPDVRRTKDVDIIVEVVGLRDHVDTEEEIRKLGFKHDISGEGHILRFLLDDLIVDILPEDGTRFGMRTGWYKTAVRTAEVHSIAFNLDIKVISAPLLLCTKFAAFDDRGEGNLLESKDIGDILAVIDGRAELLEEVKRAEDEPKQFICKRLQQLLSDPRFPEALTWQLDPDQQQREYLILNRIKGIVDLALG